MPFEGSSSSIEVAVAWTGATVQLSGWRSCTATRFVIEEFGVMVRFWWQMNWCSRDETRRGAENVQSREYVSKDIIDVKDGSRSEGVSGWSGP